jgi:YegS/Rv2252/BmrU family lipid kinase
MPRRILFIINPVSGTASKMGLQQLIKVKMATAGISYAIYPSNATGDYSFLDAEIGDFTHIAVAGGDGTINSVVQALRRHNKPFGLIPSGSGNGLAFSAGIPKDVSKALDIIISGTAQPTDAFTVNNHFACMLCGLGFDAQVAHDFANAGKRGLTTYIRKVIQNFWTAKTYPFELENGRDSLRLEAYFISIANSNQFGNQFTIAPKASLKDGMLDIVVMMRQSKWSVLLQTLKQVTGFIQLQSIEQISAEASVLYFQTSGLKIHNPSGALLHVDGDPADAAKLLEVKVLPGAFELIYP